jgi:two-component system, cell cycle sensor histidine kinase and response regulator CckA
MMSSLLNPDHYILSVSAISELSVGVLVALFGVYVLVRGRGSRTSALFCLFTACISIWLSGFGAAYASLLPEIATLWVKFGFLGVISIPLTGLLLVVAIIPQKDMSFTHKLVWLNIALSILFLFATIFTDLLIKGVYQYSWGYYPHLAPAGTVFLLNFTFTTSYILWLFLIEYRSQTNMRTRKRFKGLLLGFGIGYLATADFIADFGFPFHPIGSIVIVPSLFITAYVIIRYRLVDITPALAAGQILETMHDAILAFDLDGKLQVANRAAEVMLGLGKSELLGRPLSSLIDLPSELQTAIDAGIPLVAHEMTWPRQEGEPFVVTVSASPITKGDRTVIGVVITAHDITERKKTDEAIKKSEEKFSKVFMTTPAGISISYLDSGRLIEVNREFERLFGHGRDEIIGRTSFDIGLWTDVRDREQIVRAILAGGAVKDRVLRLCAKNGAVLTLRYSAESIELDTRRYLLSTFVDITEQKMAEEALLKSESRFRAVVENSNDGISFCTADGTILALSTSYHNITGFKPEERIGRSGLEYIHPDDLEAVRQSLAQLSQTDGAVQRAEYRIQHKDGSWRWTETSAVNMLADPNVQAIVINSRDITDRKQAEEALRESEARFRMLFENASIAMMTHDCDTGAVIEANRKALEYNGVDSVEELRARDFWSPSPYTLQDAIRKIRKAAVEGPQHFEWMDKNRRGGTFWRDVTLNRIVLGGSPRIMAIAQDITRRKLTEDALRRSEEMMRNVLDSVDEGFIVVDRDYRIITANRAFCSMVSLGSDEIIGRPCYTVSHGLQQSCSSVGEDCGARKVFETGKPKIANHIYHNAEGNTVYVETRSYPLKDASGTVISVIEAISNITEKHLLEEERNKSQKLEALGMLAGGIAHDFNNLLQGVFGYISLAKLMRENKDKSINALEEAEKALHLSVKLTNQLLTFSKGGKPVKKQLDLRPVIESAAKFALSGSRSDFRMVIPDGLWQVKADEGQIGQVIQNIVLNADQAMPVGGMVSVTAANMAEGDVSLPPGYEKKDYVVITIQDTGVGIAEQYLSKIFDPYFTTKEKGSGLGLATSYSIVRNHDGMIDVRAKSGEGSTFTIYLPAIARVAPVEAMVCPVKYSPSPAARVLLMDDEEIIRNLSSELLGALGHSVEVAKHGQEALEKYQGAMAAARPFDIVILDLTVRGGMGGSETIQKLLGIDPAVKAIVSSGYSDDAATANYEKQGFKAFLNKPYGIDALRAVLNKVLDVSSCI